MVDKERGSYLPDVDSREPCSYQTHISLPTSFHSSSSIARTHAPSRATTPAACRYHTTTPPPSEKKLREKSNQPQTNIKLENDASTLAHRPPS